MSGFVRLFPVWLVLATLLALVYPPAFTWFLQLGLVTPGLAVIMLGMGLTLRVEDFARVVRAPRSVLLGVALQYGVMPMAGFGVAALFGLPTPYAVGLTLVCCCPGGTASNVIAYLARADVALSVSLTAVSTLLAALMTPTLTTLLVGSRVEVDAWGLFASTAQVVLAPVLVGLAVRRFLPRLSERLLPWAPPAAVVAIVLIVAAIFGAQAQAMLDSGLRLLGAVVTAHAIGFGSGYVFTRVLTRFRRARPRIALGSHDAQNEGVAQAAGVAQADEIEARTVSIEVGMQNSGLGVVLARGNFADPLVALPCALSSLVHGILGSGLAAIWSKTPPSSAPKSPPPFVA